MIVIAAISLSLLPTIKPSLSFIEIDLLPLIFARFPHGPGMSLSLHHPDHGDAATA